MTGPVGGGDSLKHLETLLDQSMREGLDQEIADTMKLVLQQIKEKSFDRTEISRIVKLRDRISKLRGDEKSSEKALSVFFSLFIRNPKDELLDTSLKFFESIYSGFSRNKKKSADFIFSCIPTESRKTKEQSETIFGNIVALMNAISDDAIDQLTVAVKDIPADERANVIEAVKDIPASAI